MIDYFDGEALFGDSFRPSMLMAVPRKHKLVRVRTYLVDVVSFL